MSNELHNIIRQKLHNDYMLVEFDKMDRREYEIRRSLLKELILEIEVEDEHEYN